MGIRAIFLFKIFGYVLVYRLYQDAFINYRFGIGSAEAVFLFFLVLLLTAIQFLFMERKVHYQ